MLTWIGPMLHMLYDLLLSKSIVYIAELIYVQAVLNILTVHSQSGIPLTCSTEM